MLARENGPFSADINLSLLNSYFYGCVRANDICKIDVKLQEGDYVTASDVVAVVANTSDIYITVNVEETNILQIHTGQSVTVSLDAYGQSFAGYVEDVNTVTSEKLSGSMTSFTTSGTYTKVTQLIPVKIKLLNDIDLENIIGTNATVKIRIK